MSKELRFPQVVGALARMEGTVWGVVDALAAEVKVTKSGNAAAGQFEAVSKEAAANGIVNPTTGQAYGATWLKQLFQIGAWLTKCDLEVALELRQYPLKRVYGAKGKAGADPAKALEILREGKTFHEISGTSISGKTTPAVTPATAAATVKASSTEARVALVQEALHDPDVVAAVAADSDTRTAISEAAVERTGGRTPEQAERAKAERNRRKKEEAEEQEDVATRPGLTFLAAGSALYRARLSVIEAMGHIREGDVTDAVRELLDERVASLRELLTDLQLLAAGQKEISDEDIHLFMEQAEEDNARERSQ